uniref:Putative transport and golgi organization 2 n=1 Tax=Corethrella appendiculata TaxID=1370023 RepID=U5ETR2_9DIPT
MCILFLFADPKSLINGYKLILISNRDEFYARPAKQAAPWEENECVFGGRDMEPGREGGTWLALGFHDKIIKVGALLNITGEARRINARGRGPIVADYVKGNTSNSNYSKKLLENDNFSSFNFVTVELDVLNDSATILHTSNVPNNTQKCEQSKALGFGNSPYTTPLEKVKAGTEKFQNIIDNKENFKDKITLIEKLLSLLQEREKHWPDNELQKRAPNWGENLSSIYVKMPEAGYGSRTRTVILVDENNKIDFIEETMNTFDPNEKWERIHLNHQL